MNEHVKELSKNAINLSKKVFMTNDQLTSQEDKWLQREKELLEKIMNTIKIKEQMEEGWKREKIAAQIKEQKH